MSGRRAVQTAANLPARLAEVLHGGFVGTIELTCAGGAIARWVVEETLKSGRVLEERKPPRDVTRYVAEIEHLLEGFAGRLTLHCNDGAVVRIARHSVTETNGTHLSE